MGEWKDGGWRHYYAVGWLVKTPWPTIVLTLALPQNLWVDSDWFSVAFQGWHNLEVFAHAESRAGNFFRHPLLRPMIFCI